jgi:hypothetical protein
MVVENGLAAYRVLMAKRLARGVVRVRKDIMLLSVGRN